MADVTISSLSPIAVATTLQLPASNNTTTGKVTIADINSQITSSNVTTALGYSPVQSVAGRTGVVVLTKTDVGLSLVENKSSATIRGEITSSNVTTALGYTPGLIQVVQTLKTDVTAYNNGNITTDYTVMQVSITPKFATSRIMITVTVNGGCTTSATAGPDLKLFRNLTQIGGNVFISVPYAGTVGVGNMCASFLDTSANIANTAITYYLKVRQQVTNNYLIVNRDINSTRTFYSSLMAFEIAG
jgi:hypothetical protein